MRILVPILLVVVVAVAVVLATRGGEEPYKVRAIFDNAGFAIPGEDVKVAGVKVGKIDSLDVTDDFKAVVVLNIEDEAYQDFRRDAECQIRPQSLIGEKFVECEPTQARQANADPPPALTWSKDLTAEFHPVSGELSKLDQWGGFRYKEGEPGVLRCLDVSEDTALPETMRTGSAFYDEIVHGRRLE